jgi:type I restriction enzyme S subunit
MLVPLPPLSEQRHFASKINTMMEQARIAIIELEQLHRAKSALMSNLLTGRKRVTTDLSVAAD